MKTYYNDPVQQIQFKNKNLTKNEVVTCFNDLSPNLDSFISIINDHNDVLKFSWVSEDKWLVEYPVIANQIHQQKYANPSECIGLIGRIENNENVDFFEGFEEVPVQEFTLDEILQFKKEDQMLLNEEEVHVGVHETKSMQENNKPKSDVSKKRPKRSFLMGDVITSKNNSSVTKNKKPTIATSKKDDSSFFSI